MQASHLVHEVQDGEQAAQQLPRPGPGACTASEDSLRWESIWPLASWYTSHSSSTCSWFRLASCSSDTICSRPRACEQMQQACRWVCPRAWSAEAVCALAVVLCAGSAVCWLSNKAGSCDQDAGYARALPCPACVLQRALRLMRLAVPQPAADESRV